jgi:hypothetical protein
MSLWRNRLARSAVNRKVGGSNPPRDEFFLCFLLKLLFFFFFWSRLNTNVKENDIVHVLEAVEASTVVINNEPVSVFVVSDKRGLLVVNPHFVLSGTNVLSGMFCMRK